MSTEPNEASSYNVQHAYIIDAAAGWTDPQEVQLNNFGRRTPHARANSTNPGVNKPLRSIDKLSIKPIHPKSLHNVLPTAEHRSKSNRVHLNLTSKSKSYNHVIPVQHNVRTNRRAFHLQTPLQTEAIDRNVREETQATANKGNIDSNSDTLNPEEHSATSLSDGDCGTQLEQHLDSVELDDEVDTLRVDDDIEDLTDTVPLIPTQTTEKKMHLKERAIYHDIENDLHYPQTNSAWSWTSKDHKLHPLHYAAANGNKQYLAELLTAIKNASDPLLCLALPESSGLIDGDNLNVDMTDREGRTPLMHAAYWSHLDCIKLLLEAGADVNISTADGSTILHQAAFTGNHATLSLLLQYKVTKTALKDSEGRLPIHWATYAPSTKCLKLLLNHGSGDANATDSQGMTPLMWASYMSQPDHLEVLLRHGASQSVRDSDGVKAVHWSLNGTGDVENREKCLTVLLSLQSSCFKDSKGKTVAHYIAESGSSHSLAQLLSIRPNAVEDRDLKGRTPLHWASVCGKKSVLASLLEYGAPKSVEDSDGKTPLDYAHAKNLQECIELLTPEKESPPLVSATPPSTTSTSPDINSVVFSTEKCVLKLYDVFLLRIIGRGCYLQKYTNKGKGPKHRRYFWLNIDTGQLCWAKHDNPANSEIKTLTPVDVRPTPGLSVLGRRDFDSSFKHQLCFCILCTDSLINLVAADSQSYSVWIRGLKVYLTLGAELASQILRANSERLESFEEGTLNY